MEIEKQIQVIYACGTWGHAVRWMLDRFYKGTNFKDIDSPWDKDGRAHGFKGSDYNKKFKRGHQLAGRDDSPDPDADRIVISFDPVEHMFIERCCFYRNPGMEVEQDRYKVLISLADPAFIQEQFNGATQSKSVAKELMKIQFYDIALHEWYNTIKEMAQVKEYYQFDINSLFNEKKLAEEFFNISKRFNLNLNINDDVIKNVVEHVQNSFVVQTKDRYKIILDAVKTGKNLQCADLDIMEQAYIEMKLEQEHGVIFPYGTNWFTDTAQINDYILTYPKYLKRIDTKLPWHDRGKIDKSR